MSMCSPKQALRAITKEVERGGALGDENFDFMNAFFSRYGSKPTAQMMSNVRAALEEGERRKIFFVVRGVGGNVITVQKHDPNSVGDTDTATKPSIGNAALLPVVHRMLLDRTDDDGVIITGTVVNELLDELYDELSEQYELDKSQLKDVFDAMHRLGLRGDGAKLRKTGMEVINDCSYQSDEGNTEDRSTDDATRLRAASREIEQLKRQRQALTNRITALSTELNRVNKELEGVLEENTRLTDESARQEQSVADLRSRNAELARFRQGVIDLLDPAQQERER